CAFFRQHAHSSDNMRTSDTTQSGEYFFHGVFIRWLTELDVTFCWICRRRYLG
ncbi:hypothetical protein CDAR_462021, partial [Caerostris darwini]